MQSSQGSLVLLDVHTSAPKVFWNGSPISGVKKIRVFDNAVDDETGEVRLRLIKDTNAQEILDEMRLSGISIKEVTQ